MIPQSFHTAIPAELAGEEVVYGEYSEGGVELPPGVTVVPTEGGVPVSGGAGFGARVARGNLQSINAQISAAGGGGQVFGTWIEDRMAQPRGIAALRDEDYVTDLLSPTDLSYRGYQAYQSARELLGFYGYLARVTIESPFAGKPVLAQAGEMYSTSRAFYQLNLGGLGGAASEIGRRFLPPSDRGYESPEEYNPIPNRMPEWLPGEDYMINFRVGDPYTKVPHGEVRLPGEAYERTHTLHSDPWFGAYGAFERFKILADVAPYSDEYKVYRDITRQMMNRGMLPQEWRTEFNQILEEVRTKKRRFEMYPYRFRTAQENITKRRVTVTKFLDANTFLTEEFPDHPIRLAGVRTTSEAPLYDILSPGEQVEILIHKDKEARVSDDLLQTIRATVIKDGRNVNLTLIRSGYGREKEETDPAAIYARYTPDEIRQGARWETLSHMNIPVIHNKYLAVNSPLEFYERHMVYGKYWADWLHPVRDYLAPTFRSFAMKDPIDASLLGAFAGGVIGQAFLGGGVNTKVGAVAGALLAATASTLRSFGEDVTGETYIPYPRQQERAIEEYFDILEYIKYRGLYEQAAELARRREGVDIDRILNRLKKEQILYEAEEERLNEVKRRLIIEDKEGNKEGIRAINEQLRAKRPQSLQMELGPYTLQALQYRAEYESTLYGIDPYTSDWRMVFRALPAKDREFFTEFVQEIDPEKRKRILELVPTNQRRLYQANWGLTLDERPELTEYFKDHYLPPPDWIGWDPRVDLDLIKVKVVKNEALDMSEFNLWRDHEREAERQGVPEINPFKPDQFIGTIQSRLYQVLEGRGLRNVVVSVAPARSPGIVIDFDLIQDRSREALDIVNSLF